MIMRIFLFPMLSFLALNVSRGLAYDICAKFNAYEIPKNVLFQVPQIQPAHKQGEMVQMHDRSIEELMCFSKLNLPEKNCLSIHLVDEDYDFKYYAFLHSMFDPETSVATKIKTNPNLKKITICSICKPGCDKAMPNRTYLGRVSLGGGENFNECARVLPNEDVEAYNTNFNAQTLELGLTN